MLSADLTIAIAVANFVILLLAIVGGYIALRSSISKTSAQMQDRVRETLKVENEVLQGRVLRLEKDIVEAKTDRGRVSDLMNLLIETLEKRGIIVEIDGDLVIVTDTSGSSVTVRQKHPPTVPKTPRAGP